jgi:hypothetical protein
VLKDINLRTVTAEVVVEDIETKPTVFTDVHVRFETQGREIEVGPFEGDLATLGVRTRFRIIHSLPGARALSYEPHVEPGIAVGGVYIQGPFGLEVGIDAEFLSDEVTEAVKSGIEGKLKEPEVITVLSAYLTEVSCDWPAKDIGCMASPRMPPT